MKNISGMKHGTPDVVLASVLTASFGPRQRMVIVVMWKLQCHILTLAAVCAYLWYMGRQWQWKLQHRVPASTIDNTGMWHGDWWYRELLSSPSVI